MARIGSLNVYLYNVMYQYYFHKLNCMPFIQEAKIHAYVLHVLGDPACENNGSCYGGDCYCYYGFAGMRCEIRKYLSTPTVTHV